MSRQNVSPVVLISSLIKDTVQQHLFYMLLNGTKSLFLLQYFTKINVIVQNK